MSAGKDGTKFTNDEILCVFVHLFMCFIIDIIVVSKDGWYGKPDSSVNGSTHANHRSARSRGPTLKGLPRDNLIASPERVRGRASRAPLPQQGPAAGTKSPVLGRPARAPGSRPVNPEGRAFGVGKGNTAPGKPTRALRATRAEARCTNVGPRGTPERHAAGHNQGRRSGAKQQRPPRAANPDGAHNPQRTTTQERCEATANPHITN